MTRNRTRTRTAAAAWAVCLAAVAASGPTALADDARFDIGFLACGVVQGSVQGGGRMPPEERELLCTFTPTASRPEETYVATFQSLGANGELLPGRALIWIVMAPSMLEIGPGLLQQVYAPDAGAALRQAAPLIGQANASILLLDITDARQLGGDARGDDEAGNAIILLALKLRSTPT